MSAHTNRSRRAGALGLAGLLFVLALAACNSDDGNATASPSPDPSGTPSDASPEPTATADPDGGTFAGAFQFGFEHSGFYLDAACPGDGPVYWVAWQDFDLGTALEAATGTAPFAAGQTTTYHVTLEGNLSDEGSFGHLGQYKRELIVTDLVSAELADDCDEPGAAPVGPVDAQALAAYEAARALWDGAGIESYEFTLQRNCFCPPEFRGPFQITVVDGVVTDALYEGNPAEDGVALTVDEIFDRIEQELRRGVTTELSYDPTNGHPVTVRLDLSAIAADGGFSVDVLELTRN